MHLNPFKRHNRQTAREITPERHGATDAQTNTKKSIFHRHGKRHCATPDVTDTARSSQFAAQRSLTPVNSNVQIIDLRPEHDKSVSPRVVESGRRNGALMPGRSEPECSTNLSNCAPVNLEAVQVDVMASPAATAGGRVRAMTEEKNQLKSAARSAKKVVGQHRRIRSEFNWGLNGAISLTGGQLVMSSETQSNCNPGPRLDLSTMPLPKTLSAGKLLATKRPAVSTEYRAKFFQALLDQGISRIVDLRTLDDVAPTSGDYRPGPGESRIYESLRVTGMPALSSQDHCFRQYGLELRHLDQPPKDRHAVVTVTHFTAWPDFGTISTEHLRKLGAHIGDALIKGEGVVVHCRGGVGRTGTLVTYCQTKAKLEELAAQGQPITSTLIFDLVNAQRDENRLHRRAGCIETSAQLNLICKTLAEDFQHTELPKPA